MLERAGDNLETGSRVRGYGEQFAIARTCAFPGNILRGQ